MKVQVERRIRRLLYDPFTRGNAHETRERGERAARPGERESARGCPTLLTRRRGLRDAEPAGKDDADSRASSSPFYLALGAPVELAHPSLGCVQPERKRLPLVLAAVSRASHHEIRTLSARKPAQRGHAKWARMQRAAGASDRGTGRRMPHLSRVAFLKSYPGAVRISERGAARLASRFARSRRAENFATE